MELSGLASHSRALSNVAWSLLTSAAVRLDLPMSEASVHVSSAKARRVRAMLLAMYGASARFWLGATISFW